MDTTDDESFLKLLNDDVNASKGARASGKKLGTWQDIGVFLPHDAPDRNRLHVELPDEATWETNARHYQRWHDIISPALRLVHSRDYANVEIMKRAFIRAGVPVEFLHYRRDLPLPQTDMSPPQPPERKTTEISR